VGFAPLKIDKKQEKNMAASIKSDQGKTGWGRSS